ncbi:MAG: bifunctional phosphopantothenoylcysteine decarboxylase/phosphopantothenate--cysteine ligase CoaBC [Desulfomicrobium sp.]|nr:bifunctional phosphopantothenoylcysteine decarboxylase/phosphopantothenate--cysteine ligase CoaBC [Desulfomicrobium sp.]MDP3430719.1 bifunctional phosphopantothenoylcysteine decarboxylase/phosphopantothenate--cysteine ligase CoaBC [Desulfomicrobium sp.]
MIPAHYQFDTFHGKRIHLGVTGSIAAYKALDLTRAFLHLHLQVGVTLTESARKFVTELSFGALGADPLYTDMFTAGANFDHLEPSVADVFIVAPATANMVAKMAHGIADDLLSCQLLAYPGPILVAPAMNPRMWAALATKDNWNILGQRGVVRIEPECGSVACGDTGQGRLAHLDEIFIHTLAALSPQDLRGRKIMLTLGPTREYFDKARFWSNPSSGIMGASLAVAAALRGAEVTAITGPVDIALPSMVRRIPVVTAREMFEAAADIFPSQDIGCFTAAVADFRPPACPTGKYKKSGEPLSLTFESNADILATLSKEKKSWQQTIGFAAESQDLEANARLKLDRKNLDLIVANPIDEPGAGFAAPTNRVVVMDRLGRHESWPLLPKTEVAWRIWDWISMNTP